MKSNPAIIVPAKVYPKPSAKELSAAYILSSYFQADIKFVVRGEDKTPDFLIKNLYWELKTPIGNGKHNLQHALRGAAKQSSNIIIDARFSKIHINKIKSTLKYQFNRSKNIKKLLLIDKQGKIIDFLK